MGYISDSIATLIYDYMCIVDMAFPLDLFVRCFTYVGDRIVQVPCMFGL